MEEITTIPDEEKDDQEGRIGDDNHNQNFPWVVEETIDLQSEEVRRTQEITWRPQPTVHRSNQEILWLPEVSETDHEHRNPPLVQAFAIDEMVQAYAVPVSEEDSSVQPQPQPRRERQIVLGFQVEMTFDDSNHSSQSSLPSVTIRPTTTQSGDDSHGSQSSLPSVTIRPTTIQPSVAPVVPPPPTPLPPSPPTPNFSTPFPQEISNNLPTAHNW